MLMREYLQKVIDYIEEHINETIDAEMIANYIGFSKQYLHKVFFIYTSVNLIEYVRNRKLDYAMNDLKTGIRIIDIALKYGYSSERAFSRAFLKRFGNSPKHFRKNTLSIGDKLTIEKLCISNIKSMGGNIMVDYLSEVNFTVINSMVVLSNTIISNNPEEEVVELMTNFAADYNIKPLRKFGFDSPVLEKESEKGYRGYEYWLVIDESNIKGLFENDYIEYKGHKITKKRIKGYQYIYLRIKDPFVDPFTRIPNGWKYLVKWMEDNKDKNSFNVKTCENCLEEIKEINGKRVMDIYIPVNEL